MSPTSKERKADLARRKEIRELVFARDGGCLAEGVWGPCFGPLTAHHLLKASQGGKYEMDNLISLCAWHNAEVENRPDEAHYLGLVTKSWEADK